MPGTGLICMYAQDYIFDSGSEIDDSADEHVDGFAEEIVPRMTDRQFKLHFRMEPQSFESLLQMLHTVVDKKIVPGRPKVLLEKEAMIMIWCLANLESFRSVANRFGISKSTCWAALYRTCQLLLDVNRHFKIIGWPSQERALTIMRSVQARFHFPGVIGAIDGSHIPIKAPKEHHTSYINRKGYHSIILQGVCDHTRRFTHVYCGQAGSLHDYTVYKRSDLYLQIMNSEQNFPENSHLIGDLAYSLSPQLMVGFKDYGILTAREKNFNTALSKSRAVIENAFALLKGRFRRLKLMETVRLELISLLITAACILHNTCLASSDDLADILDLEAEIAEERRNNPNNAPDIYVDRNHENLVNGRQKRMNIVNALPLR